MICCLKADIFLNLLELSLNSYINDATDEDLSKLYTDKTCHCTLCFLELYVCNIYSSI